ncbi:MAG: trypsin-like serine protease [Deltaproteobacteria bacterium]|nr:trypsin-like serine protease [Deltaproteobacteria bacterium]
MQRLWLLSQLIIILASYAACGGNSSEDFMYDACMAIGAKIFNGQVCNVETSPIAKIQVLSPKLTAGTCSGIVVGHNTILTAAHCLQDALLVTVSVDDISFEVDKIGTHQQFQVDLDNKALFFDIAIITTFNDLGANAIPILASRNPAIGEEGIVSGYGKDNSNNSEFLLAAGNVTITDTTKNHIFSSPKNGGANPCPGDSGGPLLLFYDGELVVAGLVSSGTSSKGCGNDDITLYTNLTNPLILEFIVDNVPDAAMM